MHRRPFLHPLPRTVVQSRLETASSNRAHVHCAEECAGPHLGAQNVEEDNGEAVKSEERSEDEEDAEEEEEEEEEEESCDDDGDDDDGKQEGRVVGDARAVNVSGQYCGCLVLVLCPS